MTPANATADDQYLAAATAVMDAVALTPLHGLCRDGRMVTLDEAGVPAGVSVGWADGARGWIAGEIRMALPPPDVADLAAAALRYRRAARALGGADRPSGADYAALERERDAALAAVVQWADLHSPRAGEGGIRE